VRLHVQGVVVGTTLTMQPPLGVTGVQAANDKIKWEDIAGVTTPVIAATTVGAVVPNAVQTMPTRRAPSCGNPIFLIRIGPGVPNSTIDTWIAAGVVRRPGVDE